MYHAWKRPSFDCRMAGSLPPVLFHLESLRILGAIGGRRRGISDNIGQTRLAGLLDMTGIGKYSQKRRANQWRRFAGRESWRRLEVGRRNSRRRQSPPFMRIRAVSL